MTFCRFGRNVRLVLLLAWETLLPTCRPLPVSSQTRDMVFFLIFVAGQGPEERRPLAARGSPVNVAWHAEATTEQHLRYFGLGVGEKEEAHAPLILILIVAVIIVIAAMATGFLKISQTREAKAPQVTATRNGVTAKGGQAPAFDVETGSVKVGSKERR